MSQNNNLLTTFQRVVLSVIILSIISVILESEITIAKKYFYIFNFVNLFFAVFFLLEFIYRFIREILVEKKITFLKFIISPYNIIDFLSFAPYFLLSNMNETFLLRVFRIFRMFKLLRAFQNNTAIGSVVKTIVEKKKEIIFSLLITVFIIFVSSIILYIVEGPSNPEHFGSIPRAFWWATITLTTIGYGDVYPVTVLGKIATVIISICGIGIVAIPTGIIAGSFTSNLNNK